MSQIPTTPTIPYDVTDADYIAARDAVSREVFGVVYSSLSSQFATDLSLIGEDAFFEIVNLAKWYVLTDPNYTDPDTATDQLAPSGYFNEAFKQSWTAKAIRRFKSPQAGAIYQREHATPAIQRAAEAYDPTFNANSAIVTDETGVTNNSMIRSVINVLVRQRTPVIPPFTEAYRTMREEFVKMWDERRWEWRVKFKRLTLTTSGSLVNTDLTSLDNFDGLASKQLALVSSAGITSECTWADSTRFVELASRFWNTSSNTLRTGRPQYFFEEPRGSGAPQITWIPHPDAEYTVFANIVISPPAFGSLGTSQEGLQDLPPAFIAHLRDRIIARLLAQWGREDTDASRAMALVKKEALELAGAWSDRGASRSSARPHQSRNLLRTQLSWRGSGVIGQLD